MVVVVLDGGCWVQVCKTLDEHVARFAQTLLQGCAYAGTGNVLVVQQLLALCGEHIEAAQEEGKAWTVSDRRAPFFSHAPRRHARCSWRRSHST